MKEVRNISFLSFVAGLHYFLTIYILSPYLAQFMGEKSVGLVFAAGALLSLIIFFGAPYFLEHMSLKWAALGIAGIEIGALIGLSFTPPLAFLLPLILLLLALPGVLGYILDVFLEKAIPSEDKTGTARGMLITAVSIALVLSPIVLSLVLGEGNEYWKIFAIASITLVVFGLIGFFKLDKDAHTVRREDLGFMSILSCLMHSKDVVFGALAHLVLQVFFTWATIYIPLYLHTELGIAWSELGFVFFLMLIPFAVLEFPIGYLADKFFGEKELMIFGFVITGAALMSVSFFNSPTVSLLLIGALVMTRVGAAMVEITTETYFFKHVSSSDVTTISLFRMLRPASSLIAPLIGSLALFFVPLQFVFIVLGALVFVGVPFALTLKDTR